MTDKRQTVPEIGERFEAIFDGREMTVEAVQ